MIDGSFEIQIIVHASLRDTIPPVKLLHMKLLIIGSFVAAALEAANGVRHLLNNDSAGSITWFGLGILFAFIGTAWTYNYRRQLNKKREQAGLD
jgi:hypothetical protein